MPSNSLGPNHNEFLLAIRHSLFFLFFALLIFLFNSAILFTMHLLMFEACRSIGFLGILDSIDSSDFLDSLSFSVILSASLFMDRIFFLLNIALVLWDAFVILFSNPSV